MTEHVYDEGDRVVVAYGSWKGEHGYISKPGGDMISTEVKLDNYQWPVMDWPNNLRPESAVDQLSRLAE